MKPLGRRYTRRPYAWQSGLLGDIVIQVPLAELTSGAVVARVAAALPAGWSVRWNAAYEVGPTLIMGASFWPVAGARYAVDALTLRQLSLFD